VTRPAPALALLLAAACVTGSPKELARTHTEKAQQFRADRKLEDAAREFGEAYGHDPTNLTALRGLIEAHHGLGRLGELRARFEAAAGRAPADAYAQEALGLTLFALGAEHGPAARRALEAAVRLEPAVPDFHYRLGILLVESDAFAEARPVLARAVELDGASPRYRLPYALALARTGARADAVTQLAAVLRLRPERHEVELAERTARQVLDPFRGFPQAAREQFELALTWLEGDSPAQAQQLLDALAERFGDLAIVHALSGLAAAKLDDAGRAIAAFRRAIDLAPELAEPRQYLGELYLARGRPDTAREHLEAAIVRNPFAAEAYKHLAHVLAKLNEPEPAAAAYAGYLLLRPGDFTVQLERALLLTDLARPDAGAAWDDMVKQFPRRPEALVGRGRYYFKRALQAPTEAERSEAKGKSRTSLETALELDAENATAAEMLAQLPR
jgi:tetratricopeptide (TPR) repeat protein